MWFESKGTELEKSICSIFCELLFGMSGIWDDLGYWWECYKDKQGPDF